MSNRHTPAALREFATALLQRSGLDADKAQVVADILIEGDLLGHDTHGLALLPTYLSEIEKGSMTKTGQPKVLADFPAAVNWDGLRLPGPWLTLRAIELAAERAKTYGTCTVIIRRSHHIACLAAYLQRFTERGLMVVIMSSDPAVAGVAPHGGRRNVFTQNPIAAGWPTDGDPVLLDFSASITTGGLTRRLFNEGRKFPGMWGVDSEGVPTDDPKKILSDPPGALLPAGGLDHGHKGYSLALLVEAITGGLAGYGRADKLEGWGATVCVQVFEPALFGGREDFVRQMAHVARACRATPPLPGVERVRMPGENGLRRRADQLARGVSLYPSIMPALTPWSEKYGVPLPAAKA
jgi:LDH2 family malate/lactate/ureidoglycolate dehydrogenase